MSTLKLIGQSACPVSMLVLATIALAGPNYCYFLQSSGCGSGESFCTNGQEVCDVGYSATVDTGCGKLGPLLSGIPRKCYTLSEATTHPCDDDDPPGGLSVVGCHDGNGVCCYAAKTWARNVGSNMSVPQGANCCDLVVE